MEQLLEDEPVQWVRDMLAEWLERKDWEPEQLMDWLQGYHLPPVGHEDEPFLWLLRGLPLADQRYAAETELATRVAKVLEGRPDESRPGREPDRLLCNLYYLCAGLSCSEQLAQPLFDTFTRRKVRGEWLGLNARDALRAALITNQDVRMESVWLGMLEGRSHYFLGGNEYDGFQGIRLLGRGEPAWDAIGKALLALAVRLEDNKDRDAEFSSFVGELMPTYPGERWDVLLLPEGGKYEWPTWMFKHLPGEYSRRVFEKLCGYPFRSGRADVIRDVFYRESIALRQAVNVAYSEAVVQEIETLEAAYSKIAKAMAVGATLPIDNEAA